jgi:hypothetical protein
LKGDAVTDPQPYTYTILRYIHDMRNGEFINVGVVAYMPASSGSLESHKARLVFRIDEHHDRALCVFPDLHIEAYRLAIQSVTRTLDDQARRIEVGITPDYHNVMAIAYRAHPADDSGLRWSPVASGV